MKKVTFSLVLLLIAVIAFLKRSNGTSQDNYLLVRNVDEQNKEENVWLGN